jgi:hypothetical protein
MAVQKSNGEDYEPSSLGSMQASFMRHLKAKNYPHSIREGPLFSRHRDVIVAKRKSLKMQGKGLTLNKPFTPEEVEILYEKQLLGTSESMRHCSL